MRNLLDWKKWPDWLVRSAKTAVQAFGSVLIPELLVVLNRGWPDSWGIFWGCMAPVVSSALAAAICAVWNLALDKFREEEKSKDG